MKMHPQRVGDNIINIKDLNLEHLKEKKSYKLIRNRKLNRTTGY